LLERSVDEPFGQGCDRQEIVDEVSPVRAVKRQRKAAMLGVAFDAEDGQARITKGDNYVLCGGSEETHEVMQETAVKINEELNQRSQRLEDVSMRELRSIARDVYQQVTGKK
jgi:hypothetical protein